MFLYSQTTGELTDADGTLVGTGYSGHEEGKNNPAMQGVHNVGPIPQGLWTIGAVEDRPQDLGPCVMPLYPTNGTDTFGRSGFWIHGDSKAHPGLASHGCVIMPRGARDDVSESSDKLLRVME